MTIMPGAAAAIEQRLDEAAEAAYGVASPVADMWDPARIPAAWLPVLAWAMSSDDWVPGESEAARRTRTAGAARAHRTKGTQDGIGRMLSGLGAIYDYRETAPFEAEITIHNTDSLLVSYPRLVARVESVKRASVALSWVASAGTCQAVAVGAGVGADVSVVALLSLEAGP